WKKAEYNEYQPHRTIALAFIRMNIWIKHLLKFKFFPEDLRKGNTLNAFEYLLNPLKEINVLSETHRNLISERVIKIPYDNSTFTESITEYFEKYSIVLINEQNRTHLITRLLYILKSD